MNGLLPKVPLTPPVAIYSPMRIPGQSPRGGGSKQMGYRWKNRTDVDESVVVLMNSLEDDGSIPGWLSKTINQSIKDSDAEYGKYFFEEVRQHAPAALKYFEE
jgi:hypothetical protein